jgi:hypothetical protein
LIAGPWRSARTATSTPCSPRASAVLFVCVCARARACVCVLSRHIHRQNHALTHTHIHKKQHARTNASTHAHTHIHIHIHIHIHTHQHTNITALPHYRTHAYTRAPIGGLGGSERKSDCMRSDASKVRCAESTRSRSTHVREPMSTSQAAWTFCAGTVHSRGQSGCR